MNKDGIEYLDIFEAAEELDLSPEYIRLRVREKVIPTIKVPVREGSVVTKHMIAKESLYVFASRERAKSPRRKDGRGKKIFYATDEEALAIKELLYKTHDPGLMIVAETIQANGKGDMNEHYVPPSKSLARGQ